MIIYGRNPVIEALENNAKDINKIILLKTIKPSKVLQKIVSLANSNSIKILYLNKFNFLNYFNAKNKEEGINQGVIAFVKDYEYSSLSEIIEKCKNIHYPLILILDQITDPHNLGAIIRSAVCLGVEGIIIPRHNSAEINPTVIKTSSGATNYIPIAMETNLNNCIIKLKEQGFQIVGTDSNTNMTIFNFKITAPIALVVGNEGKGIRKLIRDNCDILIRIPITGNFDSLNVSVAASIFMYETLRQKNL